jgi:prophage regulatory protein
MYQNTYLIKPIFRLPEALNTLSISKSTFFNQLNEGLLCKPISLGERCVGYPSSEIIAILNARIAGSTNFEIKALVIELEKQRQELS